MGRPLAIWRSWSTRQRLAAGLVAGLAAAGIGVGGYLLLKRPADVSNPEAAFRPERTRKPVRTVDWPLFGFDAARTKELPTKRVRPPFRKRWSWEAGALLEFSPIVVDGRIYGINNDGVFFALDADTGKVLWKKQPGALNASSPAYHRGRLFAVNLEPNQAFSLRARDGKLLWKRGLEGRSESSPVVHDGKVIFGCECAKVYALDARTGKPEWELSVEGEVKAAPAIERGTAYVGDYAGQMYAIDVDSGKLRWQSSDQGAGLGQSGRFYSTPAVAFGRVFAGNVDGRVYSYEASGGELAWTQSTGDWVYGGVAVSDPKGRPPAVYAGSFDRNAYAFDARTGEQLWSTDVGGIISGAGSIVGDVYYVANLNGKTVGLDTRTGKQVFKFKKGEYNPVISDGQRLYLTGYSSVNALDPVKRKRGKRGEAKRKRGDKRPE